MNLHPGDRFGRYELVSWLGRGGMAETWRARLVGEAGVTKPVLIKKVLPEFANDEAFISMFISEARISATLSHGNVAQVFDFGRVGGEYFLAMEYVDGQPLHRILQRARKSGLPALPIPLAAFIAMEMCRGLHYAHTRTDDKGAPLGIVHRDISPDNVLISYEGQVKIVDFGIAKARSLRSFDTEPGVVKGKYLFFSPEQARGEEVDARTDVWATGVVLYEMLCGQRPVAGAERSAMMRVVSGRFPSPRQLRQDLPAELEEIITRALSVGLDARFESSHAFGEALADFLYRFAPRASALPLAYLVRELFQRELAQQGREMPVPATFLEELALWRSSTGASLTPAPEGDEAAPVPPPPQTELPDARAPEPPLDLNSGLPALLTKVGLGAGAVLALGAAALLQMPSAPPTPHEPVTVADAGPAAPGPVAETSGGGASPGPEQAAAGAEPASATWPVSSFWLDARRDVIVVPPDLVAFSGLVTHQTYELSEIFDKRPPPESRERVVRSPSGSPPIFFWLSGPGVSARSAVGEVTRGGVNIQGASSVSFFSLGIAFEARPSKRVIQILTEQVGSEKQFVFRPEAMRASVDGTFLLNGLEPTSIYALKRKSTGEGAASPRQARGEVGQVACVQWASHQEPTESRALASGPASFLLPEGERVYVTGSSGLRCGFIDDDPSDNEGRVEIQLQKMEPTDWEFASARRVEELARSAGAAMARRDYSRAADLARRCLDLHPLHPECLLHLGACHARRRQFGAASANYRLFITYHPKHPKVPSIRVLLADYDKKSKQQSKDSHYPEYLQNYRQYSRDYLRALERRHP